MTFTGSSRIGSVGALKLGFDSPITSSVVIGGAGGSILAGGAQFLATGLVTVAATVAASGPVAAPTVGWASDNTVRDPVFTFSGIELNDVVELTILNTSASTTHGVDTNTVDALELGNGELTFLAMPTLAYGTAYSATAKITRGGTQSAASNAVTQTIVALPATTWGEKSSFITLSNGNLTATGTDGVGAEQPVLATQAKTGKRYFEAQYSVIAGANGNIGVGLAATLPANFTDPGNAADAVFYRGNSLVKSNGVTLATYTEFQSTTTPKVIGVAIDTAANKVWFRLNGAWFGDPAAGIGGVTKTGLATMKPVATAHGLDSIVLRRLASEFTGSVPTGFTGWDN